MHWDVKSIVTVSDALVTYTFTWHISLLCCSIRSLSTIRRVMRTAGPTTAAVQAYQPGCILPAHRRGKLPKRHLPFTDSRLRNHSIAGSSCSSKGDSSRPGWADKCKVLASSAAEPTTVLEGQPMLSDLVTSTTAGPWETLAWKVCRQQRLLDNAVCIVCLHHTSPRALCIGSHASCASAI